MDNAGYEMDDIDSDVKFFFTNDKIKHVYNVDFVNENDGCVVVGKSDGNVVRFNWCNINYFEVSEELE